MQIKKSIFDKNMKLLKEYGNNNTITTTKKRDDLDYRQIRIVALTSDNVSMVDMVLDDIMMDLKSYICYSNIYFKQIYDTFKSDKSEMINIEFENNQLDIFTDKHGYTQEVIKGSNLLIKIDGIYDEIYEDRTTEIIINNDTVDTFKKECNMIKTLGGHTYLGIERSTIRYRLNTDDLDYKMDYDLNYTIYSNCKILFSQVGEVKTNLALTYKYLLKNIKKTINTEIRITFCEKEWFTSPILYELETTIGNVKYIQAPMMYD